MAAPLDRVWYNALVDDDGSGTTGTVWNKGQVNGLLNTIDTSFTSHVDKTGTPAANQLALVDDADTVQGDPALTFDTATGALLIASAGAGQAFAGHLAVQGGSGARLTITDAAQPAGQRQF